MSVSAHAEYAQADVETVPVDRLIANFERRLAELDDTAAAKSLALKARLARVHALAYAQGKKELSILKKTGDVFEGYAFVPAVPHASGPKGEDLHLARALALYEEIVSARPNQTRMRVGYAWCLEESGDSARAIEQYRAAVTAAWPKDKDVKHLEYTELTLTQEAARRLLRLLDPEEDATEMAALKSMDAPFRNVPRWITPVVVPLDDGLATAELFDMTAAVAFDLDGSGLPRRWRWITPRAAWLVWDPEGTGRITSGLQMFGAVTFWLFWDIGYDALAALDDDGDGRLAGPELIGLALWQDRDGDGVSDPGEVAPLAAWGIIGLSVAHTPHPNGYPYSAQGVEMRDGRRRPSYDWIVPAVGAPSS
jgi:tetratricopeptide (TPR) repeat protein